MDALHRSHDKVSGIPSLNTSLIGKNLKLKANRQLFLVKNDKLMNKCNNIFFLYAAEIEQLWHL